MLGAAVVSLPADVVDLLCSEAYTSLADVANLRMSHRVFRDAGSERVERALSAQMTERLRAFQKKAKRAQCAGYAAFAEFKAEAPAYPSKRAGERYALDATTSAARDEGLRVVSAIEKPDFLALSLDDEFFLGTSQINLVVADERVYASSLFLMYGRLFVMAFDQSVLAWKPSAPADAFAAGVGLAIAGRQPASHLRALPEAMRALTP